MCSPGMRQGGSQGKDWGAIFCDQRIAGSNPRVMSLLVPRVSPLTPKFSMDYLTLFSLKCMSLQIKVPVKYIKRVLQTSSPTAHVPDPPCFSCWSPPMSRPRISPNVPCSPRADLRHGRHKGDGASPPNRTAVQRWPRVPIAHSGP